MTCSFQRIVWLKICGIHDEVKKPIVILFDEANVLSLNRVLLQKIRNTFMNCPGFMFVLVEPRICFL